MPRRADPVVVDAALNTSTFAEVGTLPSGTLSAFLSVDDGSGCEVRCGAESVSDYVPAGAGFTLWDAGVTGPLKTARTVTAKALAGTPNAKLTYVVPEG